MPVYLNDTLVVPTRFPAGELGVNIKNSIQKYVNKLRLDFKSNEDLFLLALLVDAINRQMFICHHENESYIDLYMDYIPYARQDRVCNEGESLSIKVLADFINSLNFRNVQVYDPHSDVSTALFKNLVVFEQHELVTQHIGHLLNSYTIICPDAGAEKKIRKLNRPYVLCVKERSTKTGEIVSTKIVSDLSNFQDHTRALIIDDICDGGKTFLEIAKELRRKNGKFSGVDLFVTHGIFSKGFDVFKGYIDNVFWISNGKIQHKEIK